MINLPMFDSQCHLQASKTELKVEGSKQTSDYYKEPT